MTPIAIPTVARGLVRAYVKRLPGFDAWLLKQGIDSRDVKNADLVAFAAQSGKVEEVRMLIASATGNGLQANPTIDRLIDDARNGASDLRASPDDIVAVAQDAAPTMATSGFSIDALLADVDVFLSPLVRKNLAEALLPVVTAANKPAVVNTVEKVVTVQAAPVAPPGAILYAEKTGGQVPFAKLFSVRTSQKFGQTMISLWEAHGYAPPIDPYYVVDASNMAVIATAAEHGTNVWQVGPSGSGKSTQPEQFAAYTGRPFVKIAFTRQTEVASLVGGMGAKDGTTSWVDGALIAAMRRPGTVILLDEPTIAPAGVQAIIQAVTDDHRSYTIHETGEVVKAASGVVFVIADNTNGGGDDTGQYAGTNQSNAAMVNRFKRMVRVEYLTKAQETTALVNHTNIPWPAAEHVADFMQRARKLPEMEGVALSLRQMVGFVGMVKDGFPAAYSFEVAVLTRLPATERAAVETMATLQWTDAFEQLLAGVVLTNAPSNTASARAFDDDALDTI